MRVFNVQHFSLHDGPGIRSTVFFKGCPLTCQWCHNPESISSVPQLKLEVTSCVSCYRCISSCPLNRQSPRECMMCGSCMSCAKRCPTQALSVVGSDVTLDELIKDLIAQKPFYQTSGGGVTLSGGEPLMQAKALVPLLHALKNENIPVLLDTCGYAEWASLAMVSQGVDQVYYDLKCLDPLKHKSVTGVDNLLILDNLKRLCQIHKQITIRRVIIPSVNEGDQERQALIALMKDLGLKRLDLLPYHTYGQNKSEKYKINPKQKAFQKPDDALMKTWLYACEKAGLVVHVEGRNEQKS